MELRRNKIQKGIEDAELAKKELEASERIKAEKLSEAEKESLNILGAMQIKTKAQEVELLEVARKKGDELLLGAVARGNEEILKEKAKFYSEALEFVKLAIEKTVLLSPSAIDEKLIEQTVTNLRKNNIS